MTDTEVRNRSLEELTRLFEEMSFESSGTFYLYCNQGRLYAQRKGVDMPNRDYFIVLTARDFTHGLTSHSWENLLEKVQERIRLQCRSNQTSKP